MSEHGPLHPSSPAQKAPGLHPLAVVYLDRAGDAIAPSECREATSDAAWLRLALENEPLVVRGATCARAELFYRGRERACHELQSPRAALGALGLGDDGIDWIKERWGDAFNARFAALPQPLLPAVVLSALFPGAPIGWSAPPNRNHAANWLLWLDQTNPPPALRPLLGLQVALWRDHAHDEAAFYTATDDHAARSWLRQWMGLDAAKPDFPNGAGVFPREVPPSWLQSAREEWLARVAEVGFGLWDELRARPLPPVLRRVAASVVAKYFELHSSDLTKEVITALEEFLDEASHLYDLIPPAPPSALPRDASASAALAWFKREYWPFRAWQVRNKDKAASGTSSDALSVSEALTRVERTAREWAMWYLDFYATALNSGAGAEHLALHRSRSLHTVSAAGQPFAGVTLWVMADGLSVADAKKVQRHLEAKAPRLTLENRGVALAALPTITPIAKPALRWSARPAAGKVLNDALGAFAPDGTRSFSWPHGTARGRELKEYGEVGVLSAAQDGEVWVWNILEPDRTYHKNYPPDTTLADVASRLEYIAGRIASAVEAIGDHPLRVILTTDHGRLPTASVRRHPLLPGCESHGRAALVVDAGAAPAITFTNQDYIWERDEHGERVWLNPHRYGLSAPAVLAVDDGAFVQNDGGGGTEHFSHGGLYPEEVVIPWLSFGRDRAVPRIEAEITGRAKAGTPGTLQLRVRNGSEIPVILLKVTLIFGPRDEREVGLSLSLPALEPVTTQAPLLRWPDSGIAQRARATLSLARLDGTTFETAAEVHLESEELYRPASGLEEFDL